MKKIPSFTIDHIHLLRGIYVSRKDYLGDHVVTTFDIRMKEPNREPAIGYGALHTIEHLAATFLRNHPVWGDKIVFWGPMGCCTGNYFLMQGDIPIYPRLRRRSAGSRSTRLRKLSAARPAYGSMGGRQISARGSRHYRRKELGLSYYKRRIKI